MPPASSQVIRDPKRLEVLHKLLLLDTPDEPAFDRLTRLASQIIDAPVSLVSLVDLDRQYFKSAYGLPDPWASQKETPLSHSFCQHAVATQENLIIDNAREHPLVHDNLAIRDLNVVSYLGIPLVTSEGAALGSFCVIDSQPRKWTEREINIIVELAQSTMTEIELRSEIIRREESEAELRRAYAEVDAANRQLRRVTEFASATLENTIDAVNRGAEPVEILTYLQSAERGLRRKEMA